MVHWVVLKLAGKDPGIAHIYEKHAEATKVHLDAFAERDAFFALCESIRQAPGKEPIDRLLIERGPGGFTSVRIGLAFAAGLKQTMPALNVVACDCFEMVLKGWIASQRHSACQKIADEKKDRAEWYLVSVPSSRNDFFVALYRGLSFKSIGWGNLRLELIGKWTSAEIKKDSADAKQGREGAAVRLNVIGDRATEISAAMLEGEERKEIAAVEYLPSLQDYVDAVMLRLHDDAQSQNVEPVYLREPDIGLKA